MLDAVVKNNGPQQIPNKLYFRIGEVARLTGLKQHVLRYWETEFPQLHPKKSGTNQRLYRRKDVEMLLQIKDLLYEKRFTIEGARNYLEQRKPKGSAAAAAVPAPLPAGAQASLFESSSAPADLSEIRRELEAIRDLLK
jgi:DNA-binding transcriptional MerR regulator